MIGPLTVGKKAAKFGYKRFGKTGALVLGAGSVGGYFFVKRKFKSKMKGKALEDDESSQNTESSSSSQQAE